MVSMPRRRPTKKLFGLLITALVALVSWYVQQHPTAPKAVLGTVTPGSYRVVSFSDGDTVTIDMNGHNETIRFIGVDTPETHDPRKAVQCFGKAASAFTKQTIGTGSVRLEADALSSNRDRYNRLLRYVYTQQGVLVNAEIIKQGYGFAYTGFPFTKSDEFVALQTQAREGNKGLWQSCTPITNDFGGFTSNNAP
jgi:endonuclease YncB( thermonuclease family)